MANAITGKLTNLMTVVCLPVTKITSSQTYRKQMKAVSKFKGLVAQKRPPVMSTILGEEDMPHFSQPPLAMERSVPAPPHLQQKSHSVDAFDRLPVEGVLATEGVHREIDPSRQLPGQPQAKRRLFDGAVDKGLREDEQGHNHGRRVESSHTPPQLLSELSTDSGGPLSRESTFADTPTDDIERFPPFRSERSHAYTTDEVGHRGQAHNPLEEHLYLFIGPSTFAGPSGNADRRPSFMPDEDDVPIVSESPGAADIDVYETAYRDEIERIRARTRDEGKEPTVYLTRRVDARLMAMSGMAGRWMAKGEEGLERFNEATNFRERKAKVTEVSRALRAAAKDEYIKKKQQRRQEIEAERAVKSESKEPVPATSPKDTGLTDQDMNKEGPSSVPDMPKPAKSTTFRNAIAGLGLERGRQAKTSFKDLMESMKDKGKGPKSAESES